MHRYGWGLSAVIVKTKSLFLQVRMLNAARVFQVNFNFRLKLYGRLYAFKQNWTSSKALGKLVV